MKLRTALTAIVTSAVFGGIFALVVPVAPAVIYALTGINVTQ